MVPLPQALLPLRAVSDRVIQGRGRIRAQHTEEIEDHPYPRPVVISLETPYQKDDAEHDTQQNTPAMRRSIPYLFLLGITNHFGSGMIVDAAKVHFFFHFSPFYLFTFLLFYYLCSKIKTKRL
jgi:hypothetical protein